jgi:outer membrane immunogenic protein
MKKLVTVFLATAALFAAPAMASDFTGARVEVTAGADDVTGGFDTTDVVYGATIGYDVGLTDSVIAGVEANVNNVFDRRDIGASVRLGVEVNDNVLVYGKAGYSNYKDVFSRELDGLRVGGGLEVNLSDNLFTGVEYRYTDFEAGVGKHAGLVKLGLRF